MNNLILYLQRYFPVKIKYSIAKLSRDKIKAITLFGWLTDYRVGQGLSSHISTAPDKAFFATEKYFYFSYFYTKTYAVGTH